MDVFARKSMNFRQFGDILNIPFICIFGKYIIRKLTLPIITFLYIRNRPLLHPIVFVSTLVPPLPAAPLLPARSRAAAAGPNWGSTLGPIPPRKTLLKWAKILYGVLYWFVPYATERKMWSEFSYQISCTLIASISSPANSHTALLVSFG